MMSLRIRVSNRLIFCYMSCLEAAKAQPFVYSELFKNYVLDLFDSWHDKLPYSRLQFTVYRTDLSYLVFV